MVDDHRGFPARVWLDGMDWPADHRCLLVRAHGRDSLYYGGELAWRMFRARLIVVTGPVCLFACAAVALGREQQQALRGRRLCACCRRGLGRVADCSVQAFAPLSFANAKD